MKVSIVTVVVNGGGFIGDCIQSVINQDYKEVEYIVIDGKSTDNTLEIIQSYRKYIHMFVSERDNGMYEALNKGIALSTGDIVGVLNADDFLASTTVISSIVNCFIQYGCDAVHGNLDMVSRRDPQKIMRKWRSKPHSVVDLKLGWMPAHPTFYIKKATINKYQAYRPEFGVSADYELILRLLYRYRIHAVFLNRLLVCMRSGGMSNGSVRKQLRTLTDDFKVLRENNIPYPVVTVLIKRFRKIGQYL